MEVPLQWLESYYVKEPFDGIDGKINNSTFEFFFETNSFLDPKKNKQLKMRLKKTTDRINNNILREKTLIFRGLYAKREELVWEISGSIPTLNTEKPR